MADRIKDYIRIIPVDFKVRNESKGIKLYSGKVAKPVFLEYLVMFSGEQFTSGSNSMVPLSKNRRGGRVRKTKTHSALYHDGYNYLLEGKNGSKLYFVSNDIVEIKSLKSKEIIEDKHNVVGEVLRMYEDYINYGTFEEYIECLYGDINSTEYGIVKNAEMYMDDVHIIGRKVEELFSEDEINKMIKKYEDYM